MVRVFSQHWVVGTEDRFWFFLYFLYLLCLLDLRFYFAAAACAVFSIGAPTKFPHSVHDPS